MELTFALARIRAGLAWHFKRYEAEQSPEDKATYATAEAIAKADRRGLWRDAEPMGPWTFRELQRKPMRPATEEQR